MAMRRSLRVCRHACAVLVSHNTQWSMWSKQSRRCLQLPKRVHLEHARCLCHLLRYVRALPCAS